MTTAPQEANVLDALQFDVEIPCAVQWENVVVLCTNHTKNDMLNEGVMLLKYHETINFAS